MDAGIQDLLPEFLAEAKDILERMNQTLDRLPGCNNPSELLDSVYRDIHTIKGSSAMFEMGEIKQIAHGVESHLSQIKQAGGGLTDKEVALIRKAITLIEQLLQSTSQPQAAEGSKVSAAVPPAEEFIRVPASKLNTTVNAVSEIFTIRNQMVYLIERYRAGNQDIREFLQSWDLLDGAMRRGIGDLERSALAMRMMTIDGLFTRLARIVQSYSQETGKKIDLLTSGNETELDKAVLDSLGEPLVHMIRNAMDHGIEPTEERLKSGKQETGKISLSARVTGNEVVLSIRDDGRGIDSEKLVETAKKRGIDTSWVTHPRASLELIFIPGFSTAEKVTDVSGRGVGMDVVKTSLAKLGGRISIDTTQGKGTEFTVRLPVSMSLVASVLFEVNGYKYAVPNHEIIETRRVSRDQVKSEGRSKFALFRGDFVEIMEIESKFVKRKNWEPDPSRKEVALIFFEAQGKFRAVEVTSLDRNAELVVRRPEGLDENQSHLSGVSVLPTGEPLFMISLGCLTEASHAA